MQDVGGAGEAGWRGEGGGYAWQFIGICCMIQRGVVLLCRSQALQAVKIGTAALVAVVAVALAVNYGGAGVSWRTSSRGFPVRNGPLLKSGQVSITCHYV